MNRIKRLKTHLSRFKEIKYVFAREKKIKCWGGLEMEMHNIYPYTC